MRSATARIAAVFAVPLTVSTLTACGGSSDRHGAPSSTDQRSEQADHNADDIAFARNMIPHHQQAVQMAQMVPTNTTNPRVIGLANQIITTEVPGIQAFRTLVMQWQDVQGHDTQGKDATGRAAGGQGIPTVGMVAAATWTSCNRSPGPNSTGCG